MAVSLTVRYSAPPAGGALRQSYDLKVEVTNAVDISSKIFIFQRHVSSVADDFLKSEDAFVCVADPVDLIQYPEDTPEPTQNMPYYRVSSVTLKFRSMSDLLDTKELIAEDIAGLIQAAKDSADVPLQEEVTYD